MSDGVTARGAVGRVPPNSLGVTPESVAVAVPVVGAVALEGMAVGVMEPARPPAAA